MHFHAFTKQIAMNQVMTAFNKRVSRNEEKPQHTHTHAHTHTLFPISQNGHLRPTTLAEDQSFAREQHVCATIPFPENISTFAPLLPRSADRFDKSKFRQILITIARPVNVRR